MCQSVSVGLISLCPCCLLVSHGQSVFVCQSVPFGLSVSFVYLLVSDDLSVSQSVSFGFPVCLLCLSVSQSVSFGFPVCLLCLSVSQSVSFGFPVCLLCLSVQNYHHDKKKKKSFCIAFDDVMLNCKMRSVPRANEWCEASNAARNVLTTDFASEVRETETERDGERESG